MLARVLLYKLCVATFQRGSVHRHGTLIITSSSHAVWMLYLGASFCLKTAIAHEVKKRNCIVSHFQSHFLDNTMMMAPV